MPPLLAEPPEDDDDLQWAYAALGRALYVACSFEKKCRYLALVLHIQEPQPDGQSDEESFNTFVKVIGRGSLCKLNNLIVRKTNLRQNYPEMLHAARRARNYIAHDAANEFTKFSKAPGNIDQWRKTMASKLEDIAYGKIIVAVLFSRNSAESTPTQDVIDAYPKKIESWVFQS